MRLPLPRSMRKHELRVSRLFPVMAALCLVSFLASCNSDFKVLLDKNDNLIGALALGLGQVSPPRIFWTEAGGAIRQIYTDGTGESTVLNVAEPGPLLDLALYYPGNKVYWTMYSTNANAFQIRGAAINGAGEALFYEYAPSLNSIGASAIAIDHNNAMIYWNVYNAPANNKDIFRVSLSSSDPSTEQVKWVSGDKNPLIANLYVYSICIDNVSRVMYFTANLDWDINAIFVPPLLGNTGNIYIADLSIADFYSIPVAGTGPAIPSVPLRGIAVDGAGGNTYYVRYTILNRPVIVRADLSLANQTDWIDSGGGFEIKKLALDLRGRQIYWTSDSPANRIYRADLDAPNSNVEPFLLLADTPTGIAITP